MASHASDSLGMDSLGNSRYGSDASAGVKDWVQSEIVRQGQAAGLSNQDISNLLAFAKTESGFNPDAANKTTSASGVFGVTDSSAKDAKDRLSGSSLIGGYKVPDTYNRFDPSSNIGTGIAVYLDKKE